MAAVATETLPWHLHNEHSPTINSGRNEAPRYRVMRRHKGRAGILKGKTPSEASTTKQIQCSPHTRGIEEEFPHPCGSRVMEPLSQVQSEDGGERSEPLFFFFSCMQQIFRSGDEILCIRVEFVFSTPPSKNSLPFPWGNKEEEQRIIKWFGRQGTLRIIRLPCKGTLSTRSGC